MSRWILTLYFEVLVMGLWLWGPSQFAEAGVHGLDLRLHRSPDVTVERLDRPLRDRDRPSSNQAQGALPQTTVITLAKDTLKEELGKAFRGYEVKSVVFDAGKKEWSVLFEPTAAPKPAGGCVTVFVDDDTRETMLLHCR